ncbi:pleckstrin homology domain-containing family G member 7 isoform X2 [Latimeria chalumnae]|uniref:pleckstrin homology domain-containing family G member 7 isoform X2 n=1 Tax=Latimeria chalumnae TaxID=7897 RepID=UPI0003C170E1|nr:PREDICTED: pleckstrin homology domain-containing family G member 7 isoform X2 [Latimeria chalumnae]|eukprot:XP_006001762.1 PREDICTED: pleckstrin homology domain-containing family G member 7 isoform X2 [Latimeria chalumnae]
MQQLLDSNILKTEEGTCELLDSHASREVGQDQNEGNTAGSNSNDSLMTCQSTVEPQTFLINTENKETQTSGSFWNWEHVSPSSKLKDFSPEESEAACSVLFKFNRQAPARISTSPTLRKMRKNTMIQPLPHEFWDTGRLRDQKCKITDENALSISKSLPGSPKFSSSHFFTGQTAPLSVKTSTNLKSSADSQQEMTGDDITVTGNLTRDSNSNNGFTPYINDNPEFVACSQKSPDQKLICQNNLQIANLKQDRLLERRRSSIVVSLPGLEASPGDLFVSDNAANYLSNSAVTINSDTKKPKWSFLKKGTTKDKQKQISDMMNCFSTMKIPDWRECEFQMDKIFLNTLKCLQSTECLLDVDPWRLFANLDELCMVSFNFLTSLLNEVKGFLILCEDVCTANLASVLTKHFKDNLCHSLQKYCLNYTSAVFYLENLKKKEEFGIFLKWCEQNEQCKRLHLADLLVAPLHRFTRYPLLLKNIWKRSTDAVEKIAIYSIAEQVENSIRDLEGKVKWLDSYQKFRQLQEIIVWPPIWERDKRAFLPECLRHMIKDNHTESLLSSTNRTLLHEGRLLLTESTKLTDAYLFLFDDFLLLTKIKRSKKKSVSSEVAPVCPVVNPEMQSVVKDGGLCTVLDQPIPLDRLVLKNVDPFHSSAYGLRNAFLILHQNRYQQCIGVYILQAQTDDIKKAWTAQIESAVLACSKRHETKRASHGNFEVQVESSEI